MKRGQPLPPSSRPRCPFAAQKKPAFLKSFFWAGPALLVLSACQHVPNPQIQVTGQATMKVVPDMVAFSLKAYHVRPAMNDAVGQTQADIDQILAVCRKFVPMEDDIKVSHVSAPSGICNLDSGISSRLSLSWKG